MHKQKGRISESRICDILTDAARRPHRGLGQTQGSRHKRWLGTWFLAILGLQSLSGGMRLVQRSGMLVVYIHHNYLLSSDTTCVSKCHGNCSRATSWRTLPGPRRLREASGVPHTLNPESYIMNPKPFTLNPNNPRPHRPQTPV